RLQGWLAESNVDRRFRERVERAAEDWDAQGRPRGLLWRGEVLAAAVRWRIDAPVLTPAAESFLDQAERQKARSLWVRRFAVAMVILTALGVAGGSLFALQRLQEEEAEARRAREKSDELVAFMLFELHDGLSDVGRLDLLESVVGAVEEYYRDDVRGPDDAFRRTLALEHMGDVRRAQGDMESASSMYARSLELAAEYGDDSPEWLSARAESLEAQAQVQRVMGQHDIAGRLLGEARDLRQTLTANDDAEAWADLSAVELAVGDLNRTTGNLDEARLAYESALTIREMLVAEAPGNGQRRHDLAEASMRLADVAFERGAFADAEKSYRDAIVILEGVVEANPGTARWQLTLAMGQMRLSDVLNADGRPADAWDYSNSARTRFARLVRLDPANADWQLQLALADVALAGTARELGKVDEAALSVADAERALQRLLSIDPDNVDWGRALAAVQTESGLIALERGESREALAQFEKGLGAREALLAQNPDDATRMRAVASSWFHVASARRALGESDAAIVALEQSLQLRRKLAARPDRSAEWLYDL